MSNTKTIKVKSQERIKRGGEVFTPPFLVNDMLNKLPHTVWTENKTFCDPACGDGNFLVEVLQRKLDKGHKPLEALQSVFGADIMADNIREARHRLLSIVAKSCPITEEMVRAVTNNIVYLDLEQWENGSLDYNFEFTPPTDKREIKKQNEDIQVWLKCFTEDKNTTNLPVRTINNSNYSLEEKIKKQKEKERIAKEQEQEANDCNLDSMFAFRIRTKEVSIKDLMRCIATKPAKCYPID